LGIWALCSLLEILKVSNFFQTIFMKYEKLWHLLFIQSWIDNYSYCIQLIVFNRSIVFRGQSGLMGLRGFQTSHPQVWYINGFSSMSWTFWYHTWTLPTQIWPLANRTWPLLHNSRREWSTPSCDTSLDSGHQDEHLDTSLDQLSPIILDILKFLSVLSLG